MPPTPVPASATVHPHKILWMIYGYMIAIHPVLVGILYRLYGDAEPFAGAASLVPIAADPLGRALGGIGLVFLVLALVVPRHLAQQRQSSAPTNATFLTYIVRLSLFELCTVTGFVYALLREQWQLALPWAAVGLVGILLSPPTPAVLDSARRGGLR